MSDIGRFLPLSQNGGADESGVTGDWAAHAADCLDVIATSLEDLTPNQWNLLIGPEEFRLAAAVWHLADRSAAALRSPTAQAAHQITMNDLTGLAAIQSLGRMTPQSARALMRVLRSIATEFRMPPAEDPRRSRWTGRAKIRRESLRVLTDIVVTGYDIATALERELDFPAIATGAVALARVGAAPGAIRAVVNGRTIVATDAGWSFGRGPQLRGTAEELIRFLFERAGVPHHG